MPSPPQGKIVRILATSDLHMHALAWDYAAGAPAPWLGVLRFADLIAELRASADACLLLDNGDFLQGNLLGDWHVETHAPEAASVHPMIAAMNGLGYDAAGLGNHELDFGLEYLSMVARDAEFPLLCTNLRTLVTGKPPCNIHSDAILERAMPGDADRAYPPLRIGVFGVLPPDAMLWNRAHLYGRARILDIVPSAARAARRVRQAGADLVVALSHSGIEAQDRREASENASLALAALPEIDAVIAGHTHRVFPGADHTGIADADCAAGALAGTPAVMPGARGSHLGQIDLHVVPTDTGWRLADYRVAVHEAVRQKPTTRAAPESVTRAHAQALSWGREVCGTVGQPLHSYFSALRTGAAEALMAQAQLAALEPHLAAQGDAEPRVLSAISPFRSGGHEGPQAYTDLPAGPVDRNAVRALVPFSNALRAVAVDGAEVRDWIDHALAMFSQIPPGSADTPLFGPDWAPHGFDILFGVTYAIDLSVPPRRDGRPGPSRVVDLRWQGRPVGPRDRFVVITNDYRANGGGGYPGCRPGAIVLAPRITAQKALEDYLAAGLGQASEPVPPVFRFCPVPDAQALFETGPGGLTHLAQVADLPLQHLGTNGHGFEQFRLDLSRFSL